MILAKFSTADDFFVEASKLNVLLVDPPIIRDFVAVEASGDGRSMIDRRPVDLFWNIHHDIGRTSTGNRESIGRRSSGTVD